MSRPKSRYDYNQHAHCGVSSRYVRLWHYCCTLGPTRLIPLTTQCLYFSSSMNILTLNRVTPDPAANGSFAWHFVTIGYSVLMKISQTHWFKYRMKRNQCEAYKNSRLPSAGYVVSRDSHVHETRSNMASCRCWWRTYWTEKSRGDITAWNGIKPH